MWESGRADFSVGSTRVGIDYRLVNRGVYTTTRRSCTMQCTILTTSTRVCHHAPGYGLRCKTGPKRPELARPLIRPCLKLHSVARYSSGLKASQGCNCRAGKLILGQLEGGSLAHVLPRLTWHLGLALAMLAGYSDLQHT